MATVKYSYGDRSSAYSVRRGRFPPSRGSDPLLESSVGPLLPFATRSEDIARRGV